MDTIKPTDRLAQIKNENKVLIKDFLNLKSNVANVHKTNIKNNK